MRRLCAFLGDNNGKIEMFKMQGGSMKEVLYVLPFADGFVAHCISDNSVKVQVFLYEIRGACVKPTEDNPGYYLFCGMQKERNVHDRHPLLFLCEAAIPTQGELIRRLLDDAVRMKARILYADHGETRKRSEGFYADLWRATTGTKLRLKPAPSANDHEYGKALINEATMLKVVTNPSHVKETILGKQIFTTMNEESDIKDTKFYAFHALRYLMAGITKDPVRVQTIKGFAGDEQVIQTNQGKQLNAEGWT